MREAVNEFEAVLSLSVGCLSGLVDRDWSSPAGTLEWTCRETVDHMVDCVFSYALQLAAGGREGFLPFGELHALPDATPDDLLQGLRGVGAIFAAVLRSVPGNAAASDGVLPLGVDDWAARGAYEILLHTHDVLAGLGVTFEPPADLCRSVLASQTLWMLDRDRAANAPTPWWALLFGSGRLAPSPDH